MLVYRVQSTRYSTLVQMLFVALPPLVIHALLSRNMGVCMVWYA